MAGVVQRLLPFFGKSELIVVQAIALSLVQFGHDKLLSPRSTRDPPFGHMNCDALLPLCNFFSRREANGLAHGEVQRLLAMIDAQHDKAEAPRSAVLSAEV